MYFLPACKCHKAQTHEKNIPLGIKRLIPSLSSAVWLWASNSYFLGLTICSPVKWRGWAQLLPYIPQNLYAKFGAYIHSSRERVRWLSSNSSPAWANSHREQWSPRWWFHLHPLTSCLIIGKLSNSLITSQGYKYLYKCIQIFQ